MKAEDVLAAQRFYDDRVKQRGDCIEACGWKSVDSQRLRFEVLFRNIMVEGKTILDVGCGNGDLYLFLRERTKNFTYIGLDISPEMIKHAREKCRHFSNATFHEGELLTFTAPRQDIDIGVESGALTFKISNNLEYTKCVLRKLFEISSYAVSANFMSTYVDFMTENNFHYSPEELFRYAKTLSPKVALLHDYPLYEFTIQIFK